MSRLSSCLKILALAVAMATTADPVLAADMAKTTPLEDVADVKAANKIYLERKAALLLLRARFAVISIDEIPQLLATEAKAIAVTGPNVEAVADLGTDLLAEGSYYIVSLTYLATSGGAIWPGDKSETTYVNDALAKLRDLQAQLIAAIETGSDPLPILAEVDRINAWTEGFAEIPAALDHFGTRDTLVASALAATRPVRT